MNSSAETSHSYSGAAGVPVHIQTNGFILRNLTPTDATPQFLQWINSTEMQTGLNLPPLNFTHEKLVQFIKSFDNLNNYLIGIFDAQTQTLIGFYTLDVNLTHKVANITTGIGESHYEGKGVLWATIDALLDHLFIYRDIYKVNARVLATNRRMIFNFIGNPRFSFAALLYKECVKLDGERVDILLFSAFQNPEDTKKAGKFLL